MRAAIPAVCLTALLAGCGNGKWGAEIALTLGGTDAAGSALAPGSVLELQDGAWTLTVDRACLSVESATVTPEAGETESSGEDCFCHGDPPECHGDCGPTGGAATERPVFAPESRVVDLLAPAQEILRQGAAPAAFVKVAFAFSEAEDPLDPPTACADMDGRLFWLEGTLTRSDSGESWPLEVDLRGHDEITDPVTADPPATATADEPAVLGVSLRLDLALAPVDFAAVTADATGPLKIGGDPAERLAAVEQLFEGLTAAASFAAGGGR